VTANEVIIADVPYTWAEFQQGIARLHREGQQQQVWVEGAPDHHDGALG